MMDQNSEVPNLECHLSGDNSSNPWWQMELDQEYSVTAVKLFNLKNGAQNSNLEGAEIFVGNKICGKIGPLLP